MLMPLSYSSKKRNGFTIVELLIVIVVIGILATIVTVAFNGVRKNAASAVVKSSVANATKGMEAQYISTGVYGQSFPSTINVADGAGLALTYTSNTATSFCINGVYPQYGDIEWHATQTLEVKTGLCPDAIIPGSVIGTYGSSQTPSTPTSFAGVATGDGGGFVVSTNADWTSMNVKWDAVPNATRYEFQYRSSPTDTWYYTGKSNGQGGSTSTSSTYTSNIAPTVTSYDWVSPSIKPTAVGQTFEYRIRSYVNSTAGQWYTASLSPPTIAQMPALTSLNAQATSPANWTGLDVSWQGDITAIPSVKYEFMYYSNTALGWYYTAVSNGQGGYNASGGSTVRTNNIDAATKSYSWPASSLLPTTSGEVTQYRVRGFSSTISGLYGPWTTTTLTPPSNSTFVAPTSLTVAQTNNWAGLNVSWTGSTSSVPSPYYDFMYRSSPTGTWYYTLASNGQGGYASSSGSPPKTGNISSSITSFTWPSSSIQPTGAGQTYEYRVRTGSQTISGGSSPWTTATLSR